MKASLSAGCLKGQQHPHTLPRFSRTACGSEALHSRRCRLELELISRGVESPEQAADQLLRQLEAGQ